MWVEAAEEAIIPIFSSMAIRLDETLSKLQNKVRPCLLNMFPLLVGTYWMHYNLHWIHLHQFLWVEAVEEATMTIYLWWIYSTQ